MLFRIVFRRLPERFGRRRTLILGATLMAGGILCLLGIQSQWQLAPAAFVMGAGHCFVFPSLVDLAASRLPPERRGFGTSLILGAGDAGMLTGFTVFGEVIENLGFDTALVSLAVVVLFATSVFAWRSRRKRV
jgi:MFS family permease